MSLHRLHIISAQDVPYAHGIFLKGTSSVALLYPDKRVISDTGHRPGFRGIMLKKFSVFMYAGMIVSLLERTQMIRVDGTMSLSVYEISFERSELWGFGGLPP